MRSDVKAVQDPTTSRTNAITTKIMERVISYRLREIEQAVERRINIKKEEESR